MNRLDIEKHSNNYEKLLNRIVKNARLNANSVYVKNIEYKLKQYENISHNISWIYTRNYAIFFLVFFLETLYIMYLYIY